MGVSSAPLWVIGLAFVLANLPFLTIRLFGVIRLSGPKHIGWQLLELLAYYLVTGAIGKALENRAGQIAPQTWEFYAITAALFLTLAFPGFVWGHLWKHRG
jgi:hypothetical protein